MTTECKCRIDAHLEIARNDYDPCNCDIIFCPLHIAAPRLLELVKKYKGYLKCEIEDCPADSVQKFYFEELSEIESMLRDLE